MMTHKCGVKIMNDEKLARLLKIKTDENELLKQKIKMLERQLAELKENSNTDNLTGLYNRNITDEAYDQSDAVIMCDIDDFKILNDTYGHNFGDEVLKEISKMLKSCVRNSDYVIRWGGEEFLIFVKSSSIEVAANLAQRIKTRTEKLSINEYTQVVTMSFGVSKLNKKESLISDIKKVDDALYDSKKAGKNTITVFDNQKKLTLKS